MEEKKLLCIQSHLAEGTISVFSDIDTLVTFGNEKDTLKKLKLFGGKINRCFPSGSIRMEHGLENKESSNLIENIDILFIGLNPTIWLGTSKKDFRNLLQTNEMDIKNFQTIS